MRERAEDIPQLVSYFVNRIAGEEGKKVVGVDRAAMDMLVAYPWPGNVRQLENTVFRAVVLSDGELLAKNDFPQIAGISLDNDGNNIANTPHQSEIADAGAPIGQSIAETGAPQPTGDVIYTNPVPSGTAPVENGMEIAAVNEEGHLRRLQDIEGEMIRLAIDRYSGHMSEVARRLGIGRSTLYRKVRELGLEVRAANS